MSLRMTRWLGAALLALLLLAGTASAQAADPVVLELQVADQATLGEEVLVTATLRDSKGLAIQGAAIVLWSPATFLSTGGAVRLDEAATDSQGQATFRYEPRVAGTVTVNAYFPGNDRHSFAAASAEVTVQGSKQLYIESAGVQVPGLGVWLLVAVLGSVWSVYFTVVVLLTLIARAAPRSRASVGGGHG